MGLGRLGLEQGEAPWAVDGGVRPVPRHRPRPECSCCGCGRCSVLQGPRPLVSGGPWREVGAVCCFLLLSARTTRCPPASTAASALPHVPDRKPHSRAAGPWVLDPIACDGASFSPRLWEPAPFTPREQTPGRARAKARPFSPRSFAPGLVAAGATGTRDHSAATTLLPADGSKPRETLPGG